MLHRSLKLTMAATALLWAFTGLSGDAYADTFTSRGKSYRIVDGDTVARGRNRMRILGIDAPETRGGSCPGVEHTKGRDAKQYLANLLSPPNKVTLRRYKRQRDRYGREVVQLWANGRSVAALMVKSGHAVRWPGSERTDWCAAFSPSGNVPISPSGNTPAARGKVLRVRG
jgi:endonuclease YncB( thermonuclease family)